MTATTVPWTSTATPVLLPLTGGQRHALSAAAARRASITRRAARKASRCPQVPDSEQNALDAEATVAQILSNITNHVEALVIRRTDDTPPWLPQSLADLIVGEALALADAADARDMDDVAQTLANLAQLVADTQGAWLNHDTVETTTPGIWVSGGHFTWPIHYRANAEETDQ